MTDERTGICERSVVREGEPQHRDSDAIARHQPKSGMAHLETMNNHGCTMFARTPTVPPLDAATITLRSAYIDAGSPYGLYEEDFHRWAIERIKDAVDIATDPRRTDDLAGFVDRLRSLYYTTADAPKGDTEDNFRCWVVQRITYAASPFADGL